MKALIAGGVPTTRGTWADLGAGTGNFTLALAELLAPGSTIYAVDRDARALRRLQVQHIVNITIQPTVADLAHALALPPLDGIVMANVLHWIVPQAELLHRCLASLASVGRLIVVEYDTERRTPWIPYPVPPARFDALARAAGFAAPTRIGTRRSPTNNIGMYAAIAQRR